MIYSARPKLGSQSKPQPRALTSRSASLRIHHASRLGGVEAPSSLSDECQLDLELANCILSRIETRLPGRVRHLTVYTTDNAVVLTGECCTFYTKQLAQHIAMGVLEYEQLVNNINVQVSK